MRKRGSHLFLSAIAGMAGMLIASPSFAQDAGNSECLTPDCGSPNMNGGGTCTCGCGCSVWVNQTDIGKTYGYKDDRDLDGVADEKDDCPDFFDPQQDGLVLNNGVCPGSANSAPGTNGDPLRDVSVTGNNPSTQPSMTTTTGDQGGTGDGGCSMLRSHIAGGGAALLVVGFVFAAGMIRVRRRRRP